MGQYSPESEPAVSVEKPAPLNTLKSEGPSSAPEVTSTVDLPEEAQDTEATHQRQCSEDEERRDGNSVSSPPAAQPLTEEEVDIASKEVLTDFHNSDDMTEAKRHVVGMNSNPLL